MTNKEYNAKYYREHREELKERQRERYRGKVNSRLVALITDYIEGMGLKELEIKYRVGYRKEK